MALYLIAILGLALLMVVHEGGHYVAARRFGMRVVKFSIGFGPTLFKHKPKDSPTTYQVALIPFLAYVQIAGMNPWEESDPKDPGSYVNASLWGRVVTIAAGPLTNYFFASVLIFAGLLIGGKTEDDLASMRVVIGANGPAEEAGMKDKDRIVSINGDPIANWDQLKSTIRSHPGVELDIVVERGGEEIHKAVTPAPKGEKGEGMIQIGPISKHLPVSVGEAAKESVIRPPQVVYDSVKGIVDMLTGRVKPDVAGPVGIVKVTAKQAESGPGSLFAFLGLLSAYLGAFNLLPFPALDGGRLLFLGVEAVSRRRPDAKLEAKIHAFGLLMLLGLIAVVTYHELMPKR